MDGDSSGLQLRLCKNQANYPEKSGWSRCASSAISAKDGALPTGKRACAQRNTGKKTRQYHRNTKDVIIASRKKRQSQPEKFSATDWLLPASGNKGGKPKNADPTGMGKSGFRQKQKEVSVTFLPWKRSPADSDVTLRWHSQSGFTAITTTP